MAVRLLDESKALPATLVSEKAFTALSGDRLRILKALTEKPSYPAELAKELGMQVQSVYYHVRLLHDAGLIELRDYEEKGGAIAKRFACPTPALAFVLRSEWKPFSSPTLSPPSFLRSFVSDGHFDAKIVLGSPDPHGRYRARGMDYAAVELAMYFGGFASFNYPLYYLDTELKDEHKKGNLVLIGGPKVNTLLDQLNTELPIRFEDKTFDVFSSLSNKKYGENVGILEIVANPFNKHKKIFVVAGLNHLATRVAVLALLKERSRLEEGNLFNHDVFAKVVQGFDEDGDGIVDAVEVLE